MYTCVEFAVVYSKLTVNCDTVSHDAYTESMIKYP